MINADMFVLPGNQSGWLQVASSIQAPVGCVSNISSFYKIFAVQFECDLHVY